MAAGVAFRYLDSVIAPVSSPPQTTAIATSGAVSAWTMTSVNRTANNGAWKVATSAPPSVAATATARGMSGKMRSTARPMATLTNMIGKT